MNTNLFNILTIVFSLLAMAHAPAGAADISGRVTCRIDTDSWQIIQTSGRHEIRLEGFGVLGEPGKPNLPGKIVAVAIPPGAQFLSFRVEHDSPVHLDGSYCIEPSPMVYPLGVGYTGKSNRELEAWQTARDETYGSDAPFPAEPCRFVRRAGLGRYNLVDIRVAPFRYHPRSGRLFHIPSMTLTVEYLLAPGAEGTPAADSSPRSEGSPATVHSPRGERMAREAILNYDQAQSWYSSTTPPVPGQEHDFVIITIQSLVSEVVPLVNHETARGRSPEVVTMTWINANYPGYDEAARVRNFLRDKYPSSAWGIRDVLLVGHHDQVPMRICWVEAYPGSGRPRTDFYYAELSRSDEDSWDLNGNHRYGEPSGDEIDFYNEVNVGRIPWSEPDIVRSICEKSVAFELNQDPGFKKNFLALATYFVPNSDQAPLMEAILGRPWMSDWTATRLYEDNADYQSSYMHDGALNRVNVIDAWSTGNYGFVNWIGHGLPASCHILGEDNPPFIVKSDSDQLDDDHPSIIFACTCSNSDTNFANMGREMMRRGSVGFVGADKRSFGPAFWDDPTDGGSQSLDYWFTVKVTSGEMTQGEAHQWALRKLYVDGHWRYTHFETFEWNIWGNPNLRLGEGPVSTSLLAVGPGPGPDNPPQVRIFKESHPPSPVSSFRAYGIDRFGVNVAVGDLDGDGAGEIITGAGPGSVFGPHVRGWSYDGGTAVEPIPRVSFLAYGTHRWGVNVAVADINGDGADEIITGAGPGSVFGPHVRGWSFDGASSVEPMPGVSFLAYGTHRWGVNVAGGDIDGDGFDEIVTGAGPGAVFGPHVRGWDHDNGNGITAISRISFFAYAAPHHGVVVACGDVDGDGIDEMITAPGPSPSYGAHIRGWNFDGSSVEQLPGFNLLAWPMAEIRHGAKVCVWTDLTGNGRNDIVVGGGPDPSSGTPMTILSYDGTGLSEWHSMECFPELTHGANVAASQP